MPAIPITFRPLVGWRGARRRDRRRSPFQSTWPATMALLDRELVHLGARDVVLQLALTEGDIRRDGYPRANSRPSHPGVAVAFGSVHGPLWYQTDVFDDWQANVRAVALGLEALRRVDRYGITQRGEQYAGWRALPAAGAAVTTLDVGSAAAILASYSGDTPAAVMQAAPLARIAYRAALLKTHPDQGGSREAFDQVQAAWTLLAKHHGLG